MKDPGNHYPGKGEFPETTWSLVSQLKASSERKQLGLRSLCERYWKPIYCYLRQGFRKSSEDAKDLTQAFFLWLMEGELLARYAPERTNFRYYLKGILRHYVTNHEKALAALKRGGGRTMLPDGLEGMEQILPDNRELSPEEAFDRAWARQLIVDAVEQTRAGHVASGKQIRFRAYELYELAKGKRPTYTQVATELGIKTTDVSNHIYAVREAVRKQLRRAIQETVADRDQFEGEWKRFTAG